jgi:Rrf2 family protein
MKLINREVDYAMRALVYIAGKGSAVASASEMAVPLGVARPFLRKILQILNRKKILVSRKGRGGGFVLAKKPENIFLSDLMEIFQGPVSLNDCIFEERICQNYGTCSLRGKLAAVEETMLAGIKSISLKTLIKR